MIRLLACATCFTGLGGTRRAYYAATLILIILPFAILAGIGLWLWRNRQNRNGK